MKSKPFFDKMRAISPLRRLADCRKEKIFFICIWICSKKYDKILRN